MDLHQDEIILSKSERPFWHYIFAVVFFIVTLGLILYPLYLLYTLPDIATLKKEFGANIFKAVFTFVIAIGFSINRTRYLNLEKEKLQTQFRIGFFKFSIYSSMPKLNYVSVFNNTGAEQFEVNLWYEGNRHFNIMDFEDPQLAMEYGKKFSEKLELDLLDAREKGNFKWVEKQ
jgi:hypothetical protein